jgi:hypothetical protein
VPLSTPPHTADSHRTATVFRTHTAMTALSSPSISNDQRKIPTDETPSAIVGACVLGSPIASSPDARAIVVIVTSP